jgi:hypothetical protein
MSSLPRVTTAYAEYVFTNLTPIVRSGGGAYTYSQLAEMVGLKPTQHFKRRVNQLVQLGVFNLVPAFTPRGGIEKRFMIDIKHMEGMPE